MKKPVLTPSLALVDKKDVFSILDNNPSHPFLKKDKPAKGKVRDSKKLITDFPAMYGINQPQSRIKDEIRKDG
jgi:hypothetical protein